MMMRAFCNTCSDFHMEKTAPVNMELCKGFSTHFKQLALWLETTHCFNHMMELAFKDPFHKIPVFQKNDNFCLPIKVQFQNLQKLMALDGWNVSIHQ